MSFLDGQYVFDSDLNRLLHGVKGNGVLEGLAVSEASTPAMKVVGAAGSAIINGTKITKTASTELTIADADPDKPRKDIVVLSSDGTLSVVAGTPEEAAPSGQEGPYTYQPKPPDIPADSIILAEIWVAPGATAIYNEDIVDKRVFISGGEIHHYYTVFEGTEAYTTSTTYVDLGNMAITQTFPSCKVLIIGFSSNFVTEENGVTGWLGIEVDGSIVREGAYEREGGARVFAVIASVETFSAGSHTIKLKFKTGGEAAGKGLFSCYKGKGERGLIVIATER